MQIAGDRNRIQPREPSEHLERLSAGSSAVGGVIPLGAGDLTRAVPVTQFRLGDGRWTQRLTPIDDLCMQSVVGRVLSVCHCLSVGGLAAGQGCTNPERILPATQGMRGGTSRWTSRLSFLRRIVWRDGFNMDSGFRKLRRHSVPGAINSWSP